MPLHRTAPRHATYYCPCIRIRTQAHAHVHAHAHVYALVCVTCTCVCNRMWHSGAAESAVPARDRQGGAHEGTPCGTHERMCVRAHAHRCVFARIHACLHAPACLHTHARAGGSEEGVAGGMAQDNIALRPVPSDPQEASDCTVSSTDCRLTIN